MNPSDSRPATELPPQEPATNGRPESAATLEALLDVSMPIVIEIGRAQMTVQEVLQLGAGSVIQLDRIVGEPVDIYVSDRRLAQGEVVVVGEHFGVRITRRALEPGRRERGVITPGLFGVLGALAVTVAVLALALRLVQRLQGGAPQAGRGVTLRVLQRVPLGPRQGLAVVQVADRVLVVSLAEGGTRLLTELEGPARDGLLDAVPERPAAAFPRSWRLPFLGRVALVLMLAGAPLVTGPPTSAAAATPPPAVAGSTQVAPPAAKRVAAPAAIPAPAARGPVARAPAGQIGVPVPPRVDVRIGEGRDALQLSGAVGLVVFIGVLTLLPALFLLMTSFTRILIVLHFLRSALGTQTAPPNQLLVALAVLLTGVVMNPVLQQANREALQPYFTGQMTQVQAYQQGVKPFREFMLANTREQDLTLFAELSHATEAKSFEDLPIFTTVAAFVTSELRTSFQMGFVIFLPFVVVDIIVASVLMSLGMFMLPPMMISLPLKLLLFVLADGWTLVVQNLVASYR